MWEFLIVYGPVVEGAAAWVAEERQWAQRSDLEAALAAEGWELLEEQPHRESMRRVVFRRAAAAVHPDAPRHLIPCW